MTIQLLAELRQETKSKRGKTMNNTVLASQLAATYVMYDERSDAASRDRAKHDAVVKYALVSESQWKRLVAAERRARIADKKTAERIMARR